jgi:hypothetical protein
MWWKCTDNMVTWCLGLIFEYEESAGYIGKSLLPAATRIMFFFSKISSV